VLAGFCAAIAARAAAARLETGSKWQFDGYTCACAASSLLIKSAESETITGRFIDPARLIPAAASIAGSAWLKKF
jgi:hypothetical protein